jgi:hypothetical protein
MRRNVRRRSICSADPRGAEHTKTMSPGLPNPPHTPSGGASVPPLSPAARRAAARRENGSRRRAVGPSARWAPSPSISWREALIAFAAGVLLAVITSWPLVLHLPSRIEPDLGDPVRTAWEVAWVGHAMLHNPLHLFDSNAFYPHPLSLAFSDSLLGYGPAAFFGSGTVAALVRYNLLFLWAWSFCFLGAFLLARELGLRRIAAAAAGLAFAYAPYRVTEAGHLHVISSGGLPMVLFLLLRGYRRDSRPLVIVGWLLAAWQVSLGFTLGLQLAYMLAVLALIVLFCWWRGRLDPGPAWHRGQGEPPLPSGRPVAGESPQAAPQAGSPAEPSRGAGGRARGPLIPRHLLGVTLAGMVVLLAVTVYQARPYLQVAEKYPTAKRTIKEVEVYSAGPAAWLAASSENRVWGGITSGMRAKVNSKNESVFFPGGVILLLALIGLIAPGRGRRIRSSEAAASGDGGGAPGEPRGPPLTLRLRLSLALAILVVSILALGLGLGGSGYPYRLLFDYAPGWNGVRVPGRIFTLATIFYALLAAAGVEVLLRWAGHWGRRHTVGGASLLLGAVLLIAIVGEGAGHMNDPVVPQPAAAEIGLPGPVMDLPTDGALDRMWQYFSTDGFYKIPLGESTFDITALDDLRGGMYGFPDRASVEKLRYYGIKTVVLHTVPPPGLPGEVGYVFAEPPDPAAAAEKPIAGLGVTRRRVGSLVIYTIGPGPSALHGTD